MSQMYVFFDNKKHCGEKNVDFRGFVKKNNGLVGILEAVWNSNNF